MPAYKVLLRGENFAMHFNHECILMGFYATRWVFAGDTAAAERKAVELIRNDKHLRRSAQRDATINPRIYIEDMSPAPWWRALQSGSGFSFWPMDNE